MWSMLKFMFYALIVGLLIIFYAPREFVFDIWSKIKNFDFFENEEEVEEIESQGNLSAKKIKRLIIKTEQRDLATHWVGEKISKVHFWNSIFLKIEKMFVRYCCHRTRI